MVIKLNRKINGATVEFVIDEREEDKALEMMTFLSVNDYCGSCKAQDGIVWQSNRASTEKGEFLYTKRRCLKCGATSGIGKYKTGGMYWKQFEIYSKDGATPHSTNKNATEGFSASDRGKNNDIDLDEIPF